MPALYLTSRRLIEWWRSPGGDKWAGSWSDQTWQLLVTNYQHGVLWQPKGKNVSQHWKIVTSKTLVTLLSTKYIWIHKLVHIRIDSYTSPTSGVWQKIQNWKLLTEKLCKKLFSGSLFNIFFYKTISDTSIVEILLNLQTPNFFVQFGYQENNLNDIPKTVSNSDPISNIFSSFESIIRRTFYTRG